MNRICPRSPKEQMAGWIYLPRFVDKIRLHLAGKLHPEYQENFCSGFDRKWLESAGVEAENFIEVVRQSVTDGEVCDWVLKNVKKSEAEKAAHGDSVLMHGTQNDELRARVAQRKEQSNLTHRHDIKTFVDYIDADEGRG